MVITKKEFSGKRELSKHDVMSILYTLFLIGIPVLTYIQTQLMSGEPINWSVAIAGGMGALMKVIQKLVVDYETELGSITYKPNRIINPTGRSTKKKGTKKK